MKNRIAKIWQKKTSAKTKRRADVSQVKVDEGQSIPGKGSCNWKHRTNGGSVTAVPLHGGRGGAQLVGNDPDSDHLRMVVMAMCSLHWVDLSFQRVPEAITTNNKVSNE